MSEARPVGLYNARIVDVVIAKVESKDKETGQDVEKMVMFCEASLESYSDKSGNTIEVADQPVEKWRKYLVGGCLTGKGGEITQNEFKALGGELYAEEGPALFTEPLNAQLVGRPIQLLCSRGDSEKYPNQWSIFVPGSGAPKIAATKSDIAELNTLFGHVPKKKHAPAASAAPITADVF